MTMRTVGDTRHAGPDQVAIVVLHFGSAHTTERCLRSLREAYEAGAKIVVSCNASDAQSRALGEFVNTLFGCEPKVLTSGNLDHPEIASDRVVVLSNNANPGFAAGNNAGARVAVLDERVEWLWFLNNDTVVEPGSFQALLDAMERGGRNRIIGATMVDMDDPDRVQCAGGNGYNKYLSTTRPCCGGMRRHDLPSSLPDRLDYVFGASFCVPKEVFRTVGGFYEAYFLYYEELEFCRAASGMGCSPQWAREVVVRHEGGGAAHGHSSDRERRSLVQYYENHSTFVYTFRNHRALLPLVFAVRILAKNVLLPARGEAYLLRSFWLAFFDFLRGHRR